MDGLYGINEYIESSFLLLISRQVVLISPNSKGMQSLHCNHSGGYYNIVCLSSMFILDVVGYNKKFILLTV